MRETIKKIRVIMRLTNPNKILMNLHVPLVKDFVLEDEDTVNEVHAMDTLYKKQINACARKNTMGYMAQFAIRADCIYSVFSLSVELLRIYTDETSTKQKANATVGYSDYVPLLNLTEVYHH